MTLGQGAVSVVLGGFAVGVIAWGAYISAGSARNGPSWAHRRLAVTRWLPWTIGLAGAALLVLVRPWWLGAVVAYMGVVAGWLRYRAFRTVDQVLVEYGEPPATPALSPRTPGILLAAAAVIGVLAVIDITVRGWIGLFGLGVAAVVGWAALRMRPRG